MLLGHTFPDAEVFGASWIEDWLARLRRRGFDVHPFSLVFDQTRPISYFPELDLLWRLGDRRLLAMYERLARTLSNYDVFICFNGANIHPDFLRFVNCFSVYGCFDDPESSKRLSKPVAAAFDLAMVGNIAELDTYRSWGVKEVHWWPLGFREDDYDSQLTEQAILEGRRDVPVAMWCERVTGFRGERLDKFARNFPGGAYYGKGWATGFLPERERIPLLQRTRIGINIHNSTGPINFRTFYLPANGLMQICDNKKHLGKVYALDKEVVGYSSIDEAIDLTRYYLDHDDERRRIAAAGWRRAMTDYNEAACFQRVIDAVQGTKDAVPTRPSPPAPILLRRNEAPLRRAVNAIYLAAWIGLRRLFTAARAAKRKYLR